jgi:hypothetical protein
LLSFTDLISQRTVTINYTHHLSETISLEEGKKIAIQKAKEDALRKAGIGENIKSFSTLSRSQSKQDFNSVFSSDIFSNITGFCEIVEWIKKPERTFNKELNSDCIYLSFRAKIKKYDSKPDPQFVVQIKGLQAGYKSNNDNNQENNVRLKITPSLDCFLKIFYMTENEAQLVFPIETENNEELPSEFRNEILIKNQEKSINYIEPFTQKEVEFGKLIFVITKKDYSYPFAELDQDGYYTKTFSDKVFEWYMSIEPEEKNIIYKQFSIQR